MSLIEALVALAVMAFGMLGVAALQSSLRQNSDIAKQRSEATRLAQQALETWRSFTAMAVTPGELSWAELVDQAPETFVGDNATYTRQVTMPALAGGRSKNMTVIVGWDDRSGNRQQVKLTSAVTGSEPEVSTAVGIPAWGGSVLRRPRGRDAAIPPTAIDQGDGTSRFTPPGSSSYWVFNNTTGFIERTCTSSTSCIAVYLRLLSGFVNFATGLSQPLPAEAENPTSAVLSLDITVAATEPASQTINCFKDIQATRIAYYCGVPVDPIANHYWSGRTLLTGGSLSVASSATDASSSRHRVCRYTPVRGCHPAVDDPIWGEPLAMASCSGSSPTPSRKMTNEEHPLNYFRVLNAIDDQNFLVIRAGNGTTAFECPADDASTPLTQTNTWAHQPDS